MRVRIAVRTEKPVIAEVLVPVAVAVIEIPGVCENLLPVFLIIDGLVDKIPDESSLVSGIFSYQIPIFLETAFGISHGMGVLDLNQRALRVVFTIFYHIRIPPVHRGIDIRDLKTPVLLVNQKPRRVHGLDGFPCRPEIFTVSCLIAERPEYYRRVVFVNLHIVGVTRHVRILVCRILGNTEIRIHHPVGLHVGLRHHVKPVFVTEIVPIRIVRIMACPYGIDVELLHQTDILLHVFLRYEITTVRIHFMPVHAFEEYRLPVHQHVAAVQLDTAETDVLPYCFNLTSVAVIQGEQRFIKVRGLGIPLEYVFENIAHPCPAGHFVSPYRLSVRTENLDTDPAILWIIGHNGQGTFLITVRKARLDAYVRDMLPVTCIKICLAGDSGHSPEILIFKISPVAPSEHLERNQIFLSGNHERGNIELGCYLAVLAVTDKLPVYIKGYI